MKKWLLLFLLLNTCAIAQIRIPGAFVISQSQYTATYNVGTGSGNLTVDNGSSTYINGSLIIIAPGTYNTITFQNFSQSGLITVINGSGGQVIMDGTGGAIYAGFNYSNCQNLLISGTGSSDPYGFYIHDNTYRPTNISGVNRNVTMQYFSYLNIGDYFINVNNGGVIWDGTDATVVNINCKYLHNEYNNCAGTAQLGGACDSTKVLDLSRGIEFGYNVFTNCDDGDMVFGGAVDQYSIHDNILTNINATNNNDNGLFHIVGNGNFFRNYAHGYQGHVIRMWTISFGSTPETNLVYDNICDSSRKYSPFEWQSTAGSNIIASPNTTYVNVRLNNNTAGNINYEHHTEFDGCLIDNYTMPAGSTQEIYNNLLYNSFTSTSPANRFAQFDPSLQTVLLTQGNLYETDNVTAGFNQSTLTLGAGPAKNAGIPGFLIYPNDYHNLPFNISTPSIGAVQ